MNEILKCFSVDDVVINYDDEDVDFAHAKIYAVAEGNNSHKNPFSMEILKRDANTMLGKFVVAKFNKYFSDAEGHEKDEIIVGYIDPRETVSFEEKDVEGEIKTFLTVNALISKIYASDIVEMFKTFNQRSVSCEFSCIEGDEDEYGNKPILSYKMHGITILGLNYRPSSKGSEMKILQFAEKSHNKSLKEFAEERTEKLSTKAYKLNKTELKDTAWGDVDKTTMRDKIMKAKNRDLLVKSVYALVENGWQDTPSEHLKYPIMQLVGNTFYYNRYALSSALAYAIKENETSVISKIEKLYKKFDLDEETKEEEMSEETKNFSESETNDKEEHIVMEEEKKEDKVEEMAETETETPEEKEMGCGKEMSEDESADKEEEKEDKDEPKEDEKEKKFSLDGYADMGAILTLLEAETEQNVELAKKVMSEMSAQDIVMSYVAMSKELAELKEFKEELDAKEKDKKFSSIMATVKEDLDPKTFAELQEEGKQLNIEQLSAFENKVKAFAYEATKGAKTQNQEILVFGVPNETSNNSSASVDDIYKKYL